MFVEMLHGSGAGCNVNEMFAGEFNDENGLRRRIVRSTIQNNASVISRTYAFQL